MNRLKNKDRTASILISMMTAIADTDSKKSNTDLSESQENDISKRQKRPNTDLSGIKDDRTHNKDAEQAAQKEKDDEDTPDLSGDINV
ncbi:MULTISPECIES: hypothetical protein [unclassified Sphingobacterium]|uniref:hypothetical protein n=1 Tax=unclassified Sphingobacterium TaxID=2609468 RepID=UPI0025CCB85F|nr:MULTISPECIES: hypothetical protein [unclassified Sphingobacterium]